jgi:hypothetical protein
MKKIYLLSASALLLNGGTPAYSHAVKVFADDYMVSTSSSPPGGILIWYQGKHYNVSVPALK